MPDPTSAAASPLTRSRFSVALAEYLASRDQATLAAAAGISRTVLSHLVNGRRRPAQDAARAIIRAVDSDEDRAALLLAWLQDQTPDGCAHLVSLSLSAFAPRVTETPAAVGTTLEGRALAWLREQLATNIHAVRAVVDMYLASGAPEVTEADCAASHRAAQIERASTGLDALIDPIPARSTRPVTYRP